ncbi:MAG: biotin synthase BioB [Leptospiraceae bacterium]|nr:biotin synthase BioB [Leptospiraceae bacterium]
MNLITETKTSSTEESKINKAEALSILNFEKPLMEVVEQANREREKFFGKSVRIHILDNIKNGHCPEDCGYCAQRKKGNSEIQEYSVKTNEEIFQDAVQAKKNGAYRFCMVTSGTGPNEKSVESLSEVIHKISTELELKVCLSAGILDEKKAIQLKEAGLDRYNHNLNTSESHYGEICTTHSFQDRINTLSAMNQAGVGLCSGLIVGMGETNEDIVSVAFKLKELKVISIPVNFFIPIKGHAIQNPNSLSPELCIRILSVFRLVNPDSEIRIAAGREGHLRGLQSLGLFVANSVFASGYLNVKGSEISETVQMILDAGFVPEMEGLNLSFDNNSGYSEETIINLYKFRKTVN